MTEMRADMLFRGGVPFLIWLCKDHRSGRAPPTIASSSNKQLHHRADRQIADMQIEWGHITDRAAPQRPSKLETQIFICTAKPVEG